MKIIVLDAEKIRPNQRPFFTMAIFENVFYISCRLLVGAPEADAGQAGVVRGGAVYKCRPDSPGQCDLIQFDQDGE